MLPIYAFLRQYSIFEECEHNFPSCILTQFFEPCIGSDRSYETACRILIAGYEEVALQRCIGDFESMLGTLEYRYHSYLAELRSNTLSILYIKFPFLNVT